MRDRISVGYNYNDLESTKKVLNISGIDNESVIYVEELDTDRVIYLTLQESKDLINKLQNIVNEIDKSLKENN